MLIRKIDELACIDGEIQEVAITSILGLIMTGKLQEKICFTNHGKLYGAISLKKPHYTDDKKHLVVDSDVEKICGWKNKEAREVFFKGKTNSVFVVDDDDILMGAYVNGNGVISCLQKNKIFKWLKETPYIGKKILFLTQKDNLKESAQIAKEIETHMPVDVVSWKNVKGEWAQHYDVILCLNEDEKACVQFFYEKLDIKFKGQWLTCEELMKDVAAVHRRKSFVCSMEGCNLFTFNFDLNDSTIADTNYIKKFKKLMVERRRLCRSKQKLPGNEFVIPPELKEKFLDDLYTPEYWSEFKSRTYGQYKENGITWLRDVKSKYVNIENGSRINLFYSGGGTCP